MGLRRLENLKNQDRKRTKQMGRRKNTKISHRRKIKEKRDQKNQLENNTRARTYAQSTGRSIFLDTIFQLPSPQIFWNFLVTYGLLCIWYEIINY